MTELIGDGKYYKSGRKTAPLRVVLPFQMIEIVNGLETDDQITISLSANSVLSEQIWQYIKIPQAEFTKRQPADFADLMAFTVPGLQLSL